MLRTLGAKQKSGSLERYKSSVSDQNGVSPLYIMLEIHHSGQEPSKCKRFKQPRKRTVILHVRHLTIVFLIVQASPQRRVCGMGWW